jgi:iron complex outermembrane receptor protein
MSSTIARIGGIFAALSAFNLSIAATAQTESADGTSEAADGKALETVIVTGQKAKIAPNILPQTSESLTAAQIAQTINVLDAEDTLKYLPSLFVRKRNNGDTQPVLATRTWGVNSSARTLVYADNVLITALVANNNTIGAPRWGMISPNEIERVDVLYGPFAAEYAGNSMGAVVRFTTKAPEDFELTARQTESFQNFDLYGTHDTFRTDQTSAGISGRFDKLWVRLGGEHTFSQAQPLTYATVANSPVGTIGIIPALNKLGQVANVAGATGLLNTNMDNVTAKIGYDLSDNLRAVYGFGFWQNDGASHVQTFLTDTSGNPTFGGVSGFASGSYFIQEQHSSHSLALRSNGRTNFDWEVVGSHYHFDKDNQEVPISVGTGTIINPIGRVTSYDGTYWTNLDGKIVIRQGMSAADHASGLRPVGSNEISLGVHTDWYRLNNPTTNITNWADGSAFQTTSLFSLGRGMTQTSAFWAQDSWAFASNLTATAGGRLEWWSASQGYNYQQSGTSGTGIDQPKVSRNTFSPKATLTWDAATDWSVKGSFGEAYRFPTVGELFQLVTTGSTFTAPNPNLSPEKVYSEELTLEHVRGNVDLRLSLFQENVRNALIAQTSPLIAANGSISNVSYTQNIGEVQNRGVEFSFSAQSLVIDGFDLQGSATYVDSQILRDDTARSSLNAALPVSVIGKRAPNVPDWKASLLATYHVDQKLSLSIGGRYSGLIYSTIDNADRIANVYQSFNPYLVFDTRIQYALTDKIVAAFGIDNLGNEKYFEFHPFPMRSYVAELKVKY